MSRMTNLRLVLAVSFLFLIAAQALAQGDTTSAILGQVTDATNAAIPGATVTITNPQTGLQRTAKTDEEGRFDFPQLRPGTYSVKVEAEGFEPQQNDNVSFRSGPEAGGQFHAAGGSLGAERPGDYRSSAHQHGKRQYLLHSERAGLGGYSQSRRRPNLSLAVRFWRPDQYGGQQQ